MVLQHFLLVAYPLQGHINPTLQFAKKLISAGAHVTIPVTLHLHRRIAGKVAIPGLSLAPYSDGYDTGFSTIHATEAERQVYISEFKRRGSEFVSNLIASSANEGNPFTCLVYTLLLPWAADVARGFNLPTALLWVEPAAVLDILYYYFHGYGDYINDVTEKGSCSITLPGLSFTLSSRDIPSFLLLWKPSLISSAISSFEEQIVHLDKEAYPTVLVNTFEALEAEALRAVGKMNMIPIGPLIPSAFLDGKDPNDTSFGGDLYPVSNDYVEWLDSKEEKSVVYVSFGSYLELSKRQMEEIAVALLDCGYAFLWVIREQEKELGFKEELERKGKIVKWCSQVEVLSHGSVGCFVTHCGWNSTMESIVCGVPMVGFPQWTDQMTNAKLIEDVWKTGVRVDHDVNEEGLVEWKKIKGCLDVVMGSGEKGNEVRKNAEKWKGLAREAAMEGGSSDKNLKAFLDGVGQQFMHVHMAEN